MDKNTQDVNTHIASDEVAQPAVEAQMANQTKEQDVVAAQEQLQPAEQQGRFARLLNRVNTKAAKKVALYTAGAAAVVGVGIYAWKKLGSGDAVSAIVPVASE